MVVLARGLRTAKQSLNGPRHLSTAKLSPGYHRIGSMVKWTGKMCAFAAVGVVGLGTVILVHDAFTYQVKHIDRVPVSPLALHPERGGPRNLPIVRVQVDDEEDEENKRLAEKPRLVIVGGGWGVCYD